MTGKQILKRPAGRILLWAALMISISAVQAAASGLSSGGTASETRKVCENVSRPVITKADDYKENEPSLWLETTYCDPTDAGEITALVTVTYRGKVKNILKIPKAEKVTLAVTCHSGLRIKGAGKRSCLWQGPRKTGTRGSASRIWSRWRCMRMRTGPLR